MKKLFTLFAACLMAANMMGQESLQFKAVNHQADTIVRYKLYPTFNMWTFLKLDTRTGFITQVQYSTGANEFECLLGSPLTLYSDKYKTNGRFELYPTTNNWTFILLDQIDGNVYHVQWHQDSEKRGVFEIPFSYQ